MVRYFESKRQTDLDIDRNKSFCLHISYNTSVESDKLVSHILQYHSNKRVCLKNKLLKNLKLTLKTSF